MHLVQLGFPVFRAHQGSEQTMNTAILRGLSLRESSYSMLFCNPFLFNMSKVVRSKTLRIQPNKILGLGPLDN